MLNKKYLVVDCEIANSKAQEICSIGIYLVENGQIVGEPYDSLIDTEGEFDPCTIRHNGRIKKENVIGKPKFPTVWKKIKELFCNRIVVAHNALGAETIYFRKAFERYGIEKPTVQLIDTQRVAKRLRKPENLEGLCKEEGIPFKKEHKALADSKGAADILCLWLNRGDLIENDVIECAFDLKEKTKTMRNNVHDVTNKNDVLKRSSSVEKTQQISEIREKYCSKDMCPELQGKTYYLTGDFAGGTKEDIKKSIDKYGFSLVCEKSIRKKPPTDFLIVGLCGSNSRNNKKIEDAKNNGTSVYIQDTFFEILESKK